MIRASERRRSIAWIVAGLVAAALLFSLAIDDSQAHPLGNFTVNRYARLDLTGRDIVLHYVVDMAEIPAFQQISEIDTNRDRLTDEQEQAAYLDRQVEQLVDGLRLIIGGQTLDLVPETQALSFLPGEAGLETLRIDLTFRAVLAAGATNLDLHFEDSNFAGRLGWREIVVTSGPGATIEQSDVPNRSVSNALRDYPDDSLTSPLDMRAAAVVFTVDPTAVSPTDATGTTAAAAAERVQSRNSGGAATSRVARLISADRPTPMVVLVSILAASFWGAAHALTPGHGKAVVAAYLVGARGTARHAAFLGLTVTVTHTIGVFALGGLTLYFSRYILPETLYPWLNITSGVLVVGIGLLLAYRRFVGSGGGGSGVHAHYHHTGGPDSHGHAFDDHHHHDHAAAHHRDHVHSTVHVHADVGSRHKHSHDGHSHSHLPPGADGSTVSVRSLLALGISGGLVPCPSALVLLLAAISLGRLEFGMVLVLAFSLGLAGVLTGIGLLCVYARQLFQRYSFEPRVPRFLPVASAIGVVVAGCAIVFQSLGQAGVV